MFFEIPRLLSCPNGMDAYDWVDTMSNTESYVYLVSAACGKEYRNTSSEDTEKTSSE